MKQIEQGPDRRGLSGAVRTEEAEDLSRIDGHRQILDAAVLAVELAQSLRLDRGHEPMLAPARLLTATDDNFCQAVRRRSVAAPSARDSSVAPITTRTSTTSLPENDCPPDTRASAS